MVAMDDDGSRQCFTVKIRYFHDMLHFQRARVADQSSYHLVHLVIMNRKDLKLVAWVQVSEMNSVRS